MTINAALTARVMAEHKEMVRQLEAERYTHRHESIEAVQMRVLSELPDSPTQVVGRQARERWARRYLRGVA
jgi:hypothetical protein